MLSFGCHFQVEAKQDYPWYIWLRWLLSNGSKTAQDIRLIGCRCEVEEKQDFLGTFDCRCQVDAKQDVPLNIYMCLPYWLSLSTD